MCDYFKEQNKLHKQEVGGASSKSLPWRESCMSWRFWKFAHFRPQRAKPLVQFSLRIMYCLWLFTSSLILESKCSSIHVWAISLLDFYPSRMLVLFSTFMWFLRFLRLAIQIVVSGWEIVLCGFQPGHWRFHTIIKILQ